MGLLDDLKKQAELVKTQQISRESLREENLKLVDADMPAAVQKVRDALFGYRMKFEEEEIKGQRGTATKWRFTAKPSIVTDVTIQAEHEQGGRIISAKNLG